MRATLVRVVLLHVLVVDVEASSPASTSAAATKTVKATGVHTLPPVPSIISVTFLCPTAS